MILCLNFKYLMTNLIILEYLKKKQTGEENTLYFYYLIYKL